MTQTINETIRDGGVDHTPESYAAGFGCDPCYDKPPRHRGDGYKFYNFGVDGHGRTGDSIEFLRTFLPAIDRTIQQCISERKWAERKRLLRLRAIVQARFDRACPSGLTEELLKELREKVGQEVLELLPTESLNMGSADLTESIYAVKYIEPDGRMNCYIKGTGEVSLTVHCLDLGIEGMVNLRDRLRAYKRLHPSYFAG